MTTQSPSSSWLFVGALIYLLLQVWMKSFKGLDKFITRSWCAWDEGGLHQPLGWGHDTFLHNSVKAFVNQLSSHKADLSPSYISPQNLGNQVNEVGRRVGPPIPITHPPLSHHKVSFTVSLQGWQVVQPLADHRLPSLGRYGWLLLWSDLFALVVFWLCYHIFDYDLVMVMAIVMAMVIVKYRSNGAPLLASGGLGRKGGFLWRGFEYQTFTGFCWAFIL